MTAAPTPALGLFLETELSYGTEYVKASFIARQPGEDYPRNLTDHPADSLAMRGHIYNGSDGPRLIGFEPRYFEP